MFSKEIEKGYQALKCKNIRRKGRFSFFLQYCICGRIRFMYSSNSGFPAGSVVKNSCADAGATGDMGSIPGSGRFPGEENDRPLQYSFLENPIDRGS